MNALPFTSACIFFFRLVGAAFAITQVCYKKLLLGGDFLLACHRLTLAFARARVRARALPANRQSAAMPQSPVTADVHQTLDARLHFAARRAFNLVSFGYDIADARNFIVIPIADALVEIDFRLLNDILLRRVSD